MRRWEDDIKRLQGVGRGRSEVNPPPRLRLPKDICMRSRAVKVKTVVVRLMIDKHPIVGDARHMALSLADKIAGQRMVFKKLC